LDFLFRFLQQVLPFAASDGDGTGFVKIQNNTRYVVSNIQVGPPLLLFRTSSERQQVDYNVALPILSWQMLADMSSKIQDERMKDAIYETLEEIHCYSQVASPLLEHYS